MSTLRQLETELVDRAIFLLEAYELEPYDIAGDSAYSRLLAAARVVRERRRRGRKCGVCGGHVAPKAGAR